MTMCGCRASCPRWRRRSPRRRACAQRAACCCGSAFAPGTRATAPEQAATRITKLNQQILNIAHQTKQLTSHEHTFQLFLVQDQWKAFIRDEPCTVYLDFDGGAVGPDDSLPRAPGSNNSLQDDRAPPQREEATSLQPTPHPPLQTKRPSCSDRRAAHANDPSNDKYI